MSEASVSARGHQRVTSSLTVKAVGRGGDEADPCGSEGMSEAQAAAVDVELVHGDLTQLQRQQQQQQQQKDGNERAFESR